MKEEDLKAKIERENKAQEQARQEDKRAVNTKPLTETDLKNHIKEQIKKEMDKKKTENILNDLNINMC